MKISRKLVAAGLVASLAGSALFAASHEGPFRNEITARQSQMRLYAFNISQLGAMAKGMLPYDAAAASAAAGNIAALARLNPGAMWPMGSDNFSVDGTRAMPELWDNMGDVQAKGMALVSAADAMAAVAGNSLDELRGAMGALGGACSGCHKAYRQPQ